MATEIDTRDLLCLMAALVNSGDAETDVIYAVELYREVNKHIDLIQLPSGKYAWRLKE